MKIKQSFSHSEKENLSAFYELFKKSPIPEGERLANLHLFIRRQDLMRILVLDYFYKMILTVPGDIIQFGVRWGGDLVLFQNLRGAYEPFNNLRYITGFDTFAGFPAVSEVDESNVGDYSVTDDYEKYLENLLTINESFSPLSESKKFKIIKGDVTDTLPVFLAENPNQCFSLVYFDMDIYAPTKFSLEKILPFVTKGTVLIFDDFNNKGFKGESLAVKEVFNGYGSLRLQLHPLFRRLAYCIIE